MIYENVFFAQESNAEEWIRILKDYGESALLEILKDFHFPGEHEVSDENYYGKSDYIYSEGNYILSYNLNLPTVGLEYKVEET